MVGATLLALLAAVCVFRLRSRLLAVYGPIGFALGCAASYVTIQLLVHGESLRDAYVRDVVVWGLTLIITGALSLREGSYRRFAFTALIICMMTLPFLDWSYMDANSRVGLERSVNIANPNALAEWFGFCVVYFFIAGIQAKRHTVRVACWGVAAACLTVVGLTVSRATLLAIALALIVALRRLLKRGFLPLLLLVGVCAGAYASGLFDRAVSSYSERGLEDTGRLDVWPLVVKRMLDDPFTGVGVSNLGTWVPEKGRDITPHNSFLTIGLAAGVLPLALFVAYWWRACRSAMRAGPTGSTEEPFRLPLVVYAFVVVQSGAFTFLSYWVVATLSAAISAGRGRRAVPVRVPAVGSSILAAAPRI